MKKIKLGIINSTSLNDLYGGVAPFIKNLDPFLREEFDVTYICLPEKFNKIDFLPKRFIFLCYLITIWIRINKQDILLSHVPEGSFIISYSKVPIIHIFHGNTNPMEGSRFWYGKFFRSTFNFMEKRILKKAKLKYTVGTEFPTVKKILNPIYHSVTIKPTESRKGFVYAGRLESIKNIDRIIKIFAKLPEDFRQNNPFYIAGTGSQLVNLKKLVNDLSLNDSVKFVGSLANNDLIEFVSTKMILLMASSFEGLPMAIAEALSVGIPVISTDVGDISRVIKINYNGHLLPKDFSDQDYIDAIISISSNYNYFAFNAFLSSSIFNAEVIAKQLSDEMKLLINF